MDVPDLFEDIATIEAASIVQAEDDSAPNALGTIRWVDFRFRTFCSLVLPSASFNEFIEPPNPSSVTKFLMLLLL